MSCWSGWIFNRRWKVQYSGQTRHGNFFRYAESATYHQWYHAPTRLRQRLYITGISRGGKRKALPCACPLSPGTKRIKYLEENAAAADILLMKEDLERIELDTQAILLHRRLWFIPWNCFLLLRYSLIITCNFLIVSNFCKGTYKKNFNQVTRKPEKYNAGMPFSLLTGGLLPYIRSLSPVHRDSTTYV